MKKRLKKYILGAGLAVALMGIGLAAPTLHSQTLRDNIRGNIEAVGGGAGYDTGSYSDTFLETFIGQAIGLVLSFVGVIFFILILYAGIIWMTSGGEEKKVEKSKKIITASVIGLGVVMLAYAISWFVYVQLATSTGAGGAGPV